MSGRDSGYPQESEPPHFELVAMAAERLREAFQDGRPDADKRRAIDALGRALLRLKDSLDDRA